MAASQLDLKPHITTLPLFPICECRIKGLGCFISDYLPQSEMYIPNHGTRMFVREFKIFFVIEVRSREE